MMRVIRVVQTWASSDKDVRHIVTADTLERMLSLEIDPLCTPDQARSLAAALVEAADWLEREREARTDG